MALLTETQAREAASVETTLKGLRRDQILAEAAKPSRLRYDVFLSHSKMDSALVLGAKRILEQKGYSVYVDWLDDPQLDRSKVNRATADTLRLRMRKCKAMFYLHTKNAALSKWCPWELGYFDGFTYPNPRVFIFPILASGESAFKGQEYLELYPIIDIDKIGFSGGGRKDVWRYDPKASSSYKRITDVLEGA